MKKIENKVCKICGKQEPEVDFYKGNPSKCKKCKNKEDGKKKAEKAGREYNPKIKPEVSAGYKFCNNCQQTLPISEFYILSAKNKDGEQRLYSRCKTCEKEIVLNHPKREEYIKTSNENTKQRIEENPEYRQYINDLNKKYYSTESGIITHMLYAAKQRAEKNNLEFNITKEDIQLPEFCPILGIPLEKGIQGNYNMTYSLDRVDNSLGYIKGNVKVISMLANTMKNSATKEQLEAFANNILNYIQDKT